VANQAGPQTPHWEIGLEAQEEEEEEEEEEDPVEKAVPGLGR
jgi:hypothetical protein